MKQFSVAILISLLPCCNATLYAQQRVLPEAPSPQLMAQAGSPAAFPMQQPDTQSQQTPPAPAGPKLTLTDAERIAIQHNPSVSIAHLLQLAQAQGKRVAEITLKLRAPKP